MKSRIKKQIRREAIASIIAAILIVVVIVMLAPKEKPIGGETDEYGCLGPAGYSYNETLNVCVREWELNNTQREAVKVAIEEIGFTKGLTVIEVLKGHCEGCFIVNLQKEPGATFDILIGPKE